MLNTPFGINQFRPPMSLDSKGTTLQTTVGNPFGTGYAMYYPTPGAVYTLITGSAGTVSAGGLGFGTGNWTMETWCYSTSYPTSGYYSFLMEITHGGPDVSVVSTGGITVAQSFKAELINTAAGTWPLNQWNNVAIVRYGNTLSLYLNGTSIGTASVTGRNFIQDSPWNVSYVGAGLNGGTVNTWKGYQCETRFSTIARYTANFTPQTTPFVDDQYTVLLVHGGSIGNTAISDDNT